VTVHRRAGLADIQAREHRHLAQLRSGPTGPGARQQFGLGTERRRVAIEEQILAGLALALDSLHRLETPRRDPELFDGDVAPHGGDVLKASSGLDRIET
jgi:hypothetical protein